MEYAQQDDRFDAKLRINHPAFRDLIADAEAELIGIDDPNRVADLIEIHEHNMDQEIGEDTYLHEAEIIGFALEADDNEVLSGEEDFISTSQCVFHGMRIIKIGGEYKVVLEVTTDDYVDDDDVYHEKKVYFLLPESLIMFDILIEEPIMDVIARHTQIGLDIITDPAFYILSEEAQRTILIEAADRMEFDLPLLQETGVSLEANRYIAVDDLAVGDVRSQQVDQSTRPIEDRVRPSGEYLGCIIPEVPYQTKAFKHIEEFDISGGMSCIVLKNKDLGITYLIPVDAILSVDEAFIIEKDFFDLE